MASVLSLVFVLSLPVFIGCVVAYLVALNSYWKLVARDMPEAWAGARAEAGHPKVGWQPRIGPFESTGLRHPRTKSASS